MKNQFIVVRDSEEDEPGTLSHAFDLGTVVKLIQAPENLPISEDDNDGYFTDGTLQQFVGWEDVVPLEYVEVITDEDYPEVRAYENG